MLILFMSGAPADVDLYKGVIYKTNEKSKQFVDFTGAFMQLGAGRKRNERHTSPTFRTEIIALLMVRGSHSLQ